MGVWRGAARRWPWDDRTAHRPPLRCRSRSRSLAILVLMQRGPAGPHHLFKLIAVATGSMHRPQAEAAFEPIRVSRAKSCHRLAQDCSAGPAAFSGKAVEPSDVIVREIGKNASHRYTDIKSRYRVNQLSFRSS